MKKLLFGTILLAFVVALPIPTIAGVDVDVHVGIPLPPPVVFPSPPELIVIPETYVYVAPDVREDIYFHNGWWWRPWRGRWYRSRHYNSGWVYSASVPSFYGRIPSGWRSYYKDHRWRGHQWSYHRIPYHQLERNWSSWEKSRHWEKQQTWGVQGLKPRTQSPQPTRAVNTEQSRQPSREVQTQRSQPQQHSRSEVKPQHSQPQPQHGEASQHSGAHGEKHERGEVEKHDRK